MNLNVKDLDGRFVRLELLREDHREELREAADHPDVWAYMFDDATGENYDGWFDDALSLHKSGEMIVHVVRLKESGKLVGSSRYLSMDPAHARIEIGYTWYHPDQWGTEVNPECKLLMFGQAFEEMGARRVEQKTDAKNARSRAAMLKSGAKFEGVFRKHMILPGGGVRDSAYFAIIDDDWAKVKAGLEARLAD